MSHWESGAQKFNDTRLSSDIGAFGDDFAFRLSRVISTPTSFPFLISASNVETMSHPFPLSVGPIAAYSSFWPRVFYGND
jgi:hypothetical protein